MKKVELLIPVGDIDSLKQAVHNGADAVYLGGKKFGARKFAANFEKQEMVDAIKYCHLYGVKIYVVVNTIILEEELEEAYDYVKFLHINGVDAVIMQDLGLIKLVRDLLPNLEVHASTQLHNHNREDLLHLKELGIKRVVLARELSVLEIKDLVGIIDLEIFVHGALCISYSGQCLFSSMIFDRSGNRGECAGVCRLPYKLLENNKYVETTGDYLLSPKEVCTINEMKELLELGVTSFKVEGRMKSSYYVGFVTKLYRSIIDKYYNKEDISVDEDLMKQLKSLYNREFTTSHLFDQKNEDLMNIKSPNHIGIELGNVIEVTKEKIKIKLTEELNQEDGVRFVNNNTGMIANFIYNEKDMLVNHGSKGDIIYLDNKVNLEGETLVLKTLDFKLNKELSIITEKKIDVNVKVYAYINSPLKVVISDSNTQVEKTGNIVESSINSPMSKDRIIEQVSKLGNTPFIAKNIEVEMDENVFISIKELNELRRLVVEELIFNRENIKTEVIINEVENNSTSIIENNNTPCINVLVRTEEQLKAALELDVNHIYVTDKKLYEDNKENTKICLRLDRVTNNIEEFNNERLLVTELGSFYKYRNTNTIITDYYFNVVNSSYINYLLTNNVKLVTLSAESKQDNTKDIIDSYKVKYGETPNLEILVYGKVEVMVMKHCPLNMLVNKDTNCSSCSNSNNYYLEDRNKDKYKIVSSKCLTHIFNSRNRDYSSRIEELLAIGINNYRVELLDEGYETTKNILNKFIELLK